VRHAGLMASPILFLILGVVVEVGDGVWQFNNGDEIYGHIQNFTAGVQSSEEYSHSTQ